MKKGRRFNVGEPDKQIDKIDAAKYKIGEKGLSFHDIRTMKPVFAFDYLSFDGSDMCFNHEGLELDDYKGLLNCLKNISKLDYQTLHDTRNYRFHKIDFDDKRVSLTRRDFKLKLVPREELLNDENLPNLWQFDLNYQLEARAAGFLYKGVFYLVWFDRNHKIYPQK